MDQQVFLFCRACKLPHDEHGNALLTTRTLAERFNPLQFARDKVRKTSPTVGPVARTALEMSLIQATQEAYFAGMKDGVLLAYSQEFQPGEPMEKLGVEKEELLHELQAKYNTLKERKMNIGSDPLLKEASASIEAEMNCVAAKIDELKGGPF